MRFTVFNGFGVFNALLLLLFSSCVLLLCVFLRLPGIKHKVVIFVGGPS